MSILPSKATFQVVSVLKLQVCDSTWSCFHKTFTFRIKQVFPLQSSTIPLFAKALTLISHLWIVTQNLYSYSSSYDFQKLPIILEFVLKFSLQPVHLLFINTLKVHHDSKVDVNLKLTAITFSFVLMLASKLSLGICSPFVWIKVNERQFVLFLHSWL